MRRRLVALTAALAVLLLPACSGEAEPDPTGTETAATASADDVAALAGVEVSGEPGTAPTVTFDTPFTVSDYVARVVREGTGEPLSDGQLLGMHYRMLSGADATDLASTYASGQPEVFVLSTNILAAMRDALVGQSVGVQIAMGIPDTTGAGSSTLVVLEIDFARTLPERASGEAVTPAEGLPAIELAEDGAPSITPVGTDAPTELVVQPLITGTGAVTEAGQTVVAHYTGWLWDGTQFDSSWGGGTPITFTLGAGGVIEGWDTGLAGLPVGSQVLLIIPPDLGYGSTGSGSIPADATLVFVVDILDAF